MRRRSRWIGHVLKKKSYSLNTREKKKMRLFKNNMASDSRNGAQVNEAHLRHIHQAGSKQQSGNFLLLLYAPIGVKSTNNDSNNMISCFQ